jgi:alpha-tubulin suppressor-like RCC1 family protein
MPTFYNFRQDGVDYSFDDIFVPADMFREGNLWTWGYGNLSGNNRSIPVTTYTGGRNWKQVSSSYGMGLAIKTDGTLWTLGTGLDSPVTTFAGGTNWKQVSGGSSKSAIKTDGTLWTWGYNSYGQLGTNDTIDRYTPVTTFAGGTNWKQVDCGTNSMSAIKTDGTLWIWGAGISGQLGTNDTINRSTPVTTFAGGTNWKQVGQCVLTTAAIKTDGTLWVWGYGGFGQLGTNDTIDRSTPVTTFAGGTNWKQITPGFTTAAIKTDGTLWTWGFAQSGRLGTNDTINRSTPVTTFAGGINWKQVFSGRNTTAAIKTDGTLWTWGYNNVGNLGTNDTIYRSTPVTTFAGGINWKQVTIARGNLNTNKDTVLALTYDDPVI